MNWTTDTTPQEKGRNQPVPPPVDPMGLPPANHEYLVPHYQTFSSIPQTLARAYISRFDVALQASQENAWRMGLDPVIDGCLNVRTTPTSLLPVSVKPLDDNDPRQVAAAKRQETLLNMMPRRTQYRKWMLKEGIFKGKSGSQLIWQWVREWTTGRLMCYPSDFRPVNGDKLQFKWDGRAGIQVNPTSAIATHRNVDRMDCGMVYFPGANERQGLVVHKTDIEDADFYRAWYGGLVNGSGLRGKLYWIWALKSQLWGMSIEFLQWFAKGLMIYFFEHGNDTHRQAIQQWVNSQDGNTAMMYPIFGRQVAGGKEPYYPEPFRHITPGTQNPQFLQTLITQYLDDLFRFLILHQSLTTQTGATGLGSGVAEAHQTTFDQLVKLDATMLDDTETLELLSVMYRNNEPGIPCGRVMSQVDSPNIGQLIEAASAIVKMGGSVPQQPLMDAAGIPAGKPGDTLLGNVQPGQPAAVGAIPTEVPMQGAADDPNQLPVS